MLFFCYVLKIFFVVKKHDFKKYSTILFKEICFLKFRKLINIFVTNKMFCNVLSIYSMNFFSNNIDDFVNVYNNALLDNRLVGSHNPHTD